jgi:hypothetical protein
VEAHESLSLVQPPRCSSGAGRPTPYGDRNSSSTGHSHSAAHEAPSLRIDSTVTGSADGTASDQLGWRGKDGKDSRSLGFASWFARLEIPLIYDEGDGVKRR